MYNIFIRTKTSNFQIVVDFPSLSEAVSMLEDADNVMRFKVTDGENILSQHQFNMGGFTKWYDKLYV